MRNKLVSMLFAIILTCTFAAAQAEGSYPFQTTTGGQYDSMDLANLAISLRLPIRSKVGLIPFNYASTQQLSYSFSNLVQLGGHTFDAPSSGLTSDGVIVNYTVMTCPDGKTKYKLLQEAVGQGLKLSDGGTHKLGLPIRGIATNACHGDATTFAGAPADGTPYNVSLDAAAGTGTIYAIDGKYTPLTGCNVIFLTSQCWFGSTGTETDTNGNTLTRNSTQNGNIVTENLVDSLGLTALTIVSYPMPAQPPAAQCVFTDNSTWMNCVNAFDAALTPASLSYKDASNNSQSYAVTYSTYNWATAFGCPSALDPNGTTQVTLPSKVTFPDNTTLLIGYEQTPGYGTNFTTGRLTSLTLPTLGTVQYQYSGTGDGSGRSINCSDGSPVIVKRITTDGTWTYTHVSPTTAQDSTTVVDPVGNKTVYQFAYNGTKANPSPFYLTQRQSFSGATVLDASIVCYNNATFGAACASLSTLPTFPFNITTYHQVFSGTDTKNKMSATEAFLGAYNLPSETDTYDFGAIGTGYAVAVGPVLTKSYTSYGTPSGNSCVPIGNNIFDKPCVVNSNDGAGNPLSRTVYVYDANGRPTAKGTYVTPSTQLVAYKEYNANGSVKSVTDVNGTKTTITNGECGTGAFTTATSVPVGSVTLTSASHWDCNGVALLSSTDTNNNVNTFIADYTEDGADPFYRVKETQDPLSNDTIFRYSSTTSENWTAFGSSITDSLTTFDTYGRPYVQQRETAPAATTYDTVSLTRDSFGRVNQSSVPCTVAMNAGCPSVSITQTFDALGRPSVTTNADTGTITESYVYNDVLSALGPATSSVDKLKQTQVEFDAVGNVTRACDVTSGTGNVACGQANPVNGYLTVNAYDGGRLISSTYHGQTRSFAYDLLGRVTSETHPESGTTTYSYDTSSICWGGKAGDLATKTDANGNVTCFNFDPLHRATDEAGWASGTWVTGSCKRFRYDVVSNGTVTAPTGYAASNTYGRLVEAETDDCSAWPPTPITDEWFNYSARGELTDVWEKTPNSGGYYHTSASHYANGVVSSLAGVSFGTVTYNLDGEGRATTAMQGASTKLVCDPTCSTSSVTFDPAGKPLTIDIGGTADSDTYTYDVMERMKTYAFTVNNKTIGGTLTWNANGTLGSLVTTDAVNAGGAHNCNFGTPSIAGYDDLARLLRADCGSGFSQTFAYDPYSNLTKSGSFSWNPGYNSANNRFTLAGTSYDNDGHLLTDAFNAYTWDADNNMTSAVSGSSPAVCGSAGSCFIYDAFGRMVEKDVSGVDTEVLYSPMGKTAIMSGQTAQWQYVPLPGGATAYVTSASHTIWHKDWLGSPRVGSSLAGRSIVFDRAFAPYGEVYNNFGGTGEQAFTGHTQDNFTGLFETPTRELAQNAGSWLSPDSVGLSNRYAYTSNPLIFSDPSGMDPGDNQVIVDLRGGESSGGTVDWSGTTDLNTLYTMALGGLGDQGTALNALTSSDSTQSSIASPDSSLGSVTYQGSSGASSSWVSNGPITWSRFMEILRDPTMNEISKGIVEQNLPMVMLTVGGRFEEAPGDAGAISRDLSRWRRAVAPDGTPNGSFYNNHYVRKLEVLMHTEGPLQKAAQKTLEAFQHNSGLDIQNTILQNSKLVKYFNSIVEEYSGYAIDPDLSLSYKKRGLYWDTGKNGFKK